MDFLLYLTSSAMVLALFASAISVIVWTLIKLPSALVRLWRPAEKPQAMGDAPRGKFQEDTSHPLHFKRAGQ